MMYMAIKTLPYFDGAPRAWDGLTVKTPPFEASDPEQAYERALEHIVQANPFLSAMPGEITLYRLDPVGDPYYARKIGALEAPSGRESENEHE